MSEKIKVEIEIEKPTNCKDCRFGKYKNSIFNTSGIMEIDCDLVEYVFEMEFYNSCTNRPKQCKFGETNKPVYGNMYD